MATKKEINELMLKGYNYSTARYIIDRGEDYKPRPRQGVTYKQLEELGLEIVIDESEESGYKVYQNGKRRPISLRKTGQYKYGRQKFHYYTYYTFRDEDEKLIQKPISLASVI